MRITSIQNINHIRHFTILYLLVNFYRIRSIPGKLEATTAHVICAVNAVTTWVLGLFNKEFYISRGQPQRFGQANYGVMSPVGTCNRTKE